MTRRKKSSLFKPPEQLPPPPPDEPTITCPGCGKIDVLNGFDCLGACDNNIFCTECHCEFDPETGVIHECNLSAEEAAMIREGLPH